MKAQRAPFTLLCLLAMPLVAAAYSPDFAAMEDPTISERYPAGSIDSRERAEAALEEVDQAKSRVRALAQEADKGCADNFLVNRCREQVRRARVRQEDRLTAIEREARAVVRADDTKREAERQRHREEKAAAGPEGHATSRGRQGEDAAPRAPEPDTGAAARQRRRQAETERRQQQAAQRRDREEENLTAHERRLREREEREERREKARRERAEREARQRDERAPTDP